MSGAAVAAEAGIDSLLCGCGHRKVLPAQAVEALLKLADDMENAIHGGPESIARNGRRFNASERIRRIVGVEAAHE